MGLLDFLRGPNINQEVELFGMTSGAYLIDVREEDEYKGGHIPNSINIPLSKIDSIETIVEDKSAPLFLYCISGARSSEAAKYLAGKGYTNAKDIGGIRNYNGRIEK